MKKYINEDLDPIRFKRKMYSTVGSGDNLFCTEPVKRKSHLTTLTVMMVLFLFFKCEYNAISGELAKVL